jgi:hypothetical protein
LVWQFMLVTARGWEGGSGFGVQKLGLAAGQGWEGGSGFSKTGIQDFAGAGGESGWRVS